MAASRRYLIGIYEEYYKALQGEENATLNASSFISDVNQMVIEFSNISQIMNYWSGEAKDAMTNNALTTILKEFSTTQENIQETLAPACEAIDYLSQALELMKSKEDELLQNENELYYLNNHEPSKTITEGEETKDNPDYSTWQNDVYNKKNLIASQIKELDKLKEEIDKAIKLIDDLEKNLKDFSNYMSITGSILGIGESSEFSNYTLQERIKYLQEIINNYDVIYNSLNDVYQKKYGKGLTFSKEDFKNIDVIFDIFDIYWMSGVDKNALLKEDKEPALLDINKLTTIIGYCNMSGIFDNISQYLDGKSFKESGLEQFYYDNSPNFLKLNAYNENSFKNRLRDNYHITGTDDEIRAFIKNKFEVFKGSYQNLTTEFGEHQKLASTMKVIEEKKNNLIQCQKLMPFEFEMENDEYLEYVSRNYRNGINGVNGDKFAVMSQEEKALYSYLRDKKGVREAENYLSALENAFNQRIGAKKATEFIEWIKTDGFTPIDLFHSGTEGVKDGVRTFFDGFSDLFKVDSTQKGDKSALDYELVYKQQYMQELMLDPSFIDQNVDKSWAGFANLNSWYNTGSSIGNMAIPAVVGMIPGCQGLSSVLFGASIMGNSAVEAKQDGCSTGQAYLYGAITGLSETVTEKMLGGIDGLSIKALGRTAIQNMFSEGLEEFVQEYLDAGVKGIVLGDEEGKELWSNVGALLTGDFKNFHAAAANSRFNTAMEAGKQGAITSFVMNGATSASTKVVESAGRAGIAVANKTLNSNIKAPALIDAGGNVVTDPATGEVQRCKSFGEYRMSVENKWHANKTNNAINNVLNKVNNAESLTTRDRINLDSKLSTATVEELAKITSNLDEKSKEILKGTVEDMPLIGNKLSEKLDFAETFNQIENSTSLDNIDFNKIDFKEEVSRDGRTAADYIADNKANLLTESVRNEISNADSKGLKAIDSRIKENEKNYKKQMLKETLKDMILPSAKADVSNDQAQTQQDTTKVQSAVVQSEVQQEANVQLQVKPESVEVQPAVVQSEVQQEATVQQQVKPESVEIQPAAVQSEVEQEATVQSQAKPEAVEVQSAVVQNQTQELTTNQIENNIVEAMPQNTGKILQQQISQDTLQDISIDKKVDSGLVGEAGTIGLGLTGMFGVSTGLQNETTTDSTINIEGVNDKAIVEERQSNNRTTTFEENNGTETMDYDEEFFGENESTTKSFDNEELFDDDLNDSSIEKNNYNDDIFDNKSIEISSFDKTLSMIDGINKESITTMTSDSIISLFDECSHNTELSKRLEQVLQNKELRYTISEAITTLFSENQSSLAQEYNDDFKSQFINNLIKSGLINSISNNSMLNIITSKVNSETVMNLQRSIDLFGKYINDSSYSSLVFNSFSNIDTNILNQFFQNDVIVDLLNKMDSIILLDNLSQNNNLLKIDTICQEISKRFNNGENAFTLFRERYLNNKINEYLNDDYISNSGLCFSDDTMLLQYTTSDGITKSIQIDIGFADFNSIDGVNNLYSLLEQNKVSSISIKNKYDYNEISNKLKELLGKDIIKFGTSLNIEEYKIINFIDVDNNVISINVENLSSLSSFSKTNNLLDLLVEGKIKSAEMISDTAKNNLVLKEVDGINIYEVKAIINGKEQDIYTKFANLNYFFDDVKSSEILEVRKIGQFDVESNDTTLPVKVSFDADGVHYEKYLTATIKKERSYYNIDELIISSRIHNIENVEVKTVTKEELRNAFRNNVTTFESRSESKSLFDGTSYGGNQSNVRIILEDMIYGNQTSPINVIKANIINELTEKFYPNLTDIEKINLVSSYEKQGCSYMAVANSFAAYMSKVPNGEQIFKNNFGFDLYTAADGKKSLNVEAIAYDMFLNQSNNRSYIEFVNDKNLGAYINLKSIFTNYFESHGIKIDYKSSEALLSEIDTSIEGLRNICMSELLNNNDGYTILMASKFDMDRLTDYRGRDSKSNDGALQDSTEVGTKKVNVGGHAMLVTDIDQNGDIIVSSWSEKYKIDLSCFEREDSVRNGEFRFASIKFKVMDNMIAPSIDLNHTEMQTSTRFNSMEFNNTTSQIQQNKEETKTAIIENGKVKLDELGRDLVEKAKTAIKLDKNVENRNELIEKTMNNMYDHFMTYSDEVLNNIDFKRQLFEVESLLDNEYLPINTIPKFNENISSNFNNINQELEYAVYSARRELSKYHDLKNDSLAGECPQASDYFENACNKLGLETIHIGIDNSLRPGMFHHFTIVKARLKDGSYRCYLADCSYRQFFVKRNSNPKRIGVLTGHLKGCSIGSYMMLTDQRRQIAEKILTDGFIELTPEVFKEYFDSIIYSGRDGEYYRKNDLDYMNPNDVIPSYSVNDYLQMLLQNNIINENDYLILKKDLNDEGKPKSNFFNKFINRIIN